MRKHLFILLLLCSHLCNAQTAIHYTTDNGLYTNYLFGAMMDDAGFVWVYSNTGIAKFDGYTFKHFGVNEGLATNDVWGLMQDAEGRIWCIAYSDKLNYILDDSVFTVSKEDIGNLVKHNQYNALLNVVKQAGQTYVQLSGADWFLLKENKLLPCDYTSNIELRASTSYFSALPGEMCRVQNDSIQLLDHLMRPLNKKIYIGAKNNGSRRFVNVQPVRDRNIALISNGTKNYNTIKILNKDKVRVITKKELGWENQSLKQYVQLIQNQLMLSNSYGDVLHIDNDLNIVSSYRNKEFGVNTSRRGFMDKKGNVWIASLGKGLYLIPHTKRNVRFVPLGKADENEEAKIIKKINDTFYITSKPAKLYKLDKNYHPHKISRTVDEAISGSKALIRFNKGVLLFHINPIFYSTQTGATYHLFKQKKTIAKEGVDERVLQNGNTKAAVRKNDNEFFVSTAYGLLHYNLVKNEAKGIAEGRFYSLDYDLNNGIWYGGPTGLHYWDEKTNKNSDTLISQLNVQIEKLKVDGRNLWIGTNGLGLWKLNLKNGKVVQISTIKGSSITDIFTKDSLLWVASLGGVEAIDKEKLELVYSINKFNALPEDVTNSIWVENDTLLALTPSGLSIVPLAAFRNGVNENIEVRITDFEINGQPVKKTGNIPYGTNQIGIRFTSLEYEKMNSVTYHYRLSNNESWRTTKNNFLQFENLASGDYEFQIYTDGNKESVTKFKFSVASPFWKTWWFLLGSLLLVGLAVYLIYKNRIKQIEAEAQKENETNNKIADLKLNALQSQMNPHFIFNALGSIQYYQTENVALADEYLGKFARLMRLFLESSKNKFMLIDDELEMLNLYLQLEKVRMPDKLHYKITIDDQIDGSIDEVPTMLIQPFVENAINHGIFHKRERGNLKIDFKLTTSDMLQVIIEDDGVGRKKSAALKKDGLKVHISRALQIVEDKIAVLKETDNKVQFEIEDLISDSGAPLGTKVILTLPY